MKRVGKFAIVALLVFLSFGIRSLPCTDVFQGNRTYFFGTDPYYHMRRVVLTLARYPHVPIYDAYVNYPSGALVNWPGGFDLLLATLVRAVAPDPPAPDVIDRICALAIPAFGAATVALFFLIARQFFSFGFALLAAFFLAFSGGHILVSRIGRVDHHVLEFFFPALAFFLYLRALAAPAGSRVWRALLVLAGLSFALSFTIWTGSVMFLGIFILYAFCHQASCLWTRNTDDSVSRGARWVLCSSALALLPLCAASPWGRRGEILYLALSWFQVLVPFYAALALTAGDLARNRLVRAKHGFPAYLLLLLLVAAALLALTLLVQPGIAETLRDAWEFLSRREPQIHSLGESQSVWVAGADKRDFLYGKLFWLLPLLGLYALGRPLVTRGGGPRYLLLFLWFASTGTLAALQIRFTPAFTLPLCLYWALLLRDVQGLAGRLGRRRGNPGLYRWLPLPLYLFIALASVLGSLNQPRQTGLPRLLATFYDIPEVTPPTSHLLQPAEQSEYAVLSFWPWGHHLNYLSRRPNIANPFGQAAWYLQGVRDSYRFLLAEDEAFAEALSRRLGARYILVYSLNRHRPSFARYRSMLFPEAVREPSPEEDFLRVYPCVMTNRMLLLDGGAPAPESECASTLPLEQFRLVYESAARSRDRITGQETSIFKLFERVPGARIQGRGPAGEVIALSVPVTTNQGRAFTYRREIRADEQGRFEARVPYATSTSAPSAISTGPCTVRWRQGELALEISEEDVQRGRVVPAGP